MSFVHLRLQLPLLSRYRLVMQNSALPREAVRSSSQTDAVIVILTFGLTS
jgi:hypothetical protein